MFPACLLGAIGASCQQAASALGPLPSGTPVEVGVGVGRGEVMASTIIILLGFLPILFGFSAL